MAEWTRRGDVIASSAAHASAVTVDEVLERVVADPDLQPLIALIVDVAARTNSTAKLGALGAVLGEAVSSRPWSRADELLIVNALRDLEDGHIDMLRIMERTPVELLAPRMGLQDSNWRLDLLTEAGLSVTPLLARAYLSGLERNGLVVAESGYGLSYEITDFGRAMLGVFRAAGEVAGGLS
jgi:hypothetical protein